MIWFKPKSIKRNDAVFGNIDRSHLLKKLPIKVREFNFVALRRNPFGNTEIDANFNVRFLKLTSGEIRSPRYFASPGGIFN